MSLINNNIFNNIIQISKSYYEIAFNEDFQNIDVYLTDDIIEDTKQFVNIDDITLTECNGRYIAPNAKTSNPIILLNQDNFFHEGYPFVATILHELTHASDYDKFCAEYCNGDWLSIYINDKYLPFIRWSEFHSRIISIMHMHFLLPLLYPNQYSYNGDEVKNEMLNRQLPRYNDELLTDINNSNILYGIIKYCARFYVCKLYNPRLSFKTNVPQQVLNQFPTIEFLYYDLEHMRTYEEASENLDILAVLLDNLV